MLTILLAIIAPLRPYLIQYTIDEHVLNSDSKGLLFYICLLLALLIVQTIIQYYHSYLSNFIGQMAIKDIRIKLFAHLQRLRVAYFDKTPIGQLVTRVISDLETIADVFSGGLVNIIGDLLQIISIFIVMFYIDWKVALVVISVIPLLVLATYIFKEKIKVAFNDVRNRVAQLNVFLQEHISGMMIVQLFARENQEFEKFQSINKAHQDAHIRSVWYYSIFFPVVELLSAISLGLLIWYGGKAVLAESISVGVIISFIMFINMLFRPIRELADKFNTLQMGVIAANRIFEILDYQNFTENKGELKPDKLKGKIEFKEVEFGYKPNEPVLKKLSFSIQPGQVMAIVGSTGSGKTTIINLLNRFYDIQSGCICIDDAALEDYELGYLRGKIGTVLQDVFLFSGSISDNIKLFNDHISDEEVIKAAKAIGAHRFIEQLPGGYNFNVRERGLSLSAGQAQLISFVRTIVQNPDILILDEATSSIDTEHEDLIQQATEKLLQDRTSIVIAHRLSTITKADQIMVLEKGEIKEMGTHTQLLEKRGYYHQLYEKQFNTSELIN
jgi:ATP-binding cassette, subfamily B, multidrug efflux pump